ncbi:DNA polymerase III subunit gamma/tau [uncultured Psychromonas sp.]|uniref:DNA polymerase III subunit gamma/tau n=1 Tax=uncultured Psychromonas sp. TaxID=173974 RepID=UPI00261436AE|nr:DNA polymerase III subunit gamma/tau [uncultured Psychromonas sp.]
MSYQVLARKWRPQSFKEVIGQPHVLTALENGLTQDRVHHAYLFSGTRGVGKTTIARILAKSLNCETGVTATPCGVCANCQAIDQGRFVDLLEIDAASRTKVDDTRELLDNVQYKPAQGRYKVYLIDEVHMLSKHSFNALLKTLEEPPEYVKFLLATTDPQKLPITVLSRCLQFHLKAIMPEQIEQQLAAILDHEKATYEQPALGVIAKAADGSMRDALSLTDQALAFGAGNIKYAAVLKMLGTIDQSHLHYLLHFIASGNSQKVFEKIQEFVHLGADFAALHQELASLCHQIALMQLQLNANVTDKTTVQLLAERLTPEEVQLFYQIAVQGFKDYAYAPNGKVALEMTVMRLLAFKPANYIDIDESMLVKAQQVETIKPVAPETRTETQPLTARPENLATQTEPVKPQATPIAATVPESVSQQAAVPLQTENAVPAQIAAVQPVVQQTTDETEVAAQSAAPEQPSTPYQPDYQQPRDQAAYIATEQHAVPENIHASEQHVTAAQYEQPTAAPVHETASDPAAVAQTTSTPPVQSEPAPASFDLAATTNSRNMLRSHRLKREELKKIEAATGQKIPKANDRFAASEVTAPATPVTEPLKKKVVEPSTVTHAVPVEKTPMPIRAVEAKSNERLSNQHSNNDHSNNQQASPNHSTNEQELPPLTSYQEQPHNQNNYDDYNGDYSGNDYGDTDNSQKNNDYFDDHSDKHAKGADVTTAPTSDHHVQNDYFEDTKSVSTDANAAHLNASNSSASQASIAKPSASAQVITEVIPEKAPAAKTVVANHDISTLNQSASSTEVMLVNDPNLQSAEIDIAAYVEDKMTDAWFLAIKAMELVGFEKLLAKSCVMQQKDQAIALKLHKSQAHLLNNQSLCEDLKNKLSHYYGQQYTITIEQGEVAGSYTPMELEQVVYQQYLDNAKTSIKNDPIVQTLVRDYAAKVYENSVVPL